SATTLQPAKSGFFSGSFRIWEKAALCTDRPTMPTFISAEINPLKMVLRAGYVNPIPILVAAAARRNPRRLNILFIYTCHYLALPKLFEIRISLADDPFE